jgi:hypothetical protein
VFSILYWQNNEKVVFGIRIRIDLAFLNTDTAFQQMPLYLRLCEDAIFVLVQQSGSSHQTSRNLTGLVKEMESFKQHPGNFTGPVQKVYGILSQT